MRFFNFIHPLLSYFLIVCLGACNTSDPRAQYDRSSAGSDTISAKYVEDEIPGLNKENRTQAIESVLPYFQNDYLYTSLSEALEADPQEVTRLRLKSMGLRSLPEAVLNFPNLKQLDLSDNGLSTLPDSFSLKLTRLEILSLAENNFQKFPESLSSLTQLGYLDFQKNKLRDLPPSFSSLQSLKALFLNYNRFQEIPLRSVHLANLMILELDGIPLDSIPEDILKLVKLKSLSLEHCQLSVLPLELCQLTQLESLSLANNTISELPSELRALKNLNYLSLAGNGLSNIEVLLSLKQLQNLDLNLNPLGFLPPSFFRSLSKLKALNLDYTQLTDIDDGIRQCEGLVWLSLQGLPIGQVPNSLKTCKRLRVLILGNSPGLDLALTFDVLKELPALHTLKLIRVYPQQDQITFPDNLGELRHLVELNLKGNRIENLPQLLSQMGKLPRLEALNLAQCQVRSASEAFKGLAQLRLLGLDLANIPPLELQKIPELLPPDAEIIEGSQFFSYRLLD